MNPWAEVADFLRGEAEEAAFEGCNPSKVQVLRDAAERVEARGWELANLGGDASPPRWLGGASS